MTDSPSHSILVNVGPVDKNRNLNNTLIWIEWLDSNLGNPHIFNATIYRDIKTGLTDI